jgi:hypothetical protein
MLVSIMWLLLQWAVIGCFYIVPVGKIFGMFSMTHFIFFGMLFNNIHMWSATDVRYEQGAWLRVYGVPVHAWNDAFFKLCVMNVGRFVRTDECTVDKARLDFARVLISTSQLEILNMTSDFIIDGSLYNINLVEE